MDFDNIEHAAISLKHGNKFAFDYIYDNTYKVVFFVIYKILKSKTASEDITHDTYMTALKNISSYQSDNFVAWLTTIAKRLAINAYNKQKRCIATDFSAEEYRNKSSDKAFPDEDSFGLLAKARDTLDEIDFQIVIMYAIAGYRRREISQILDIPTSTVTFRYSKALATLKTELSKGGAK